MRIKAISLGLVALAALALPSSSQAGPLARVARAARAFLAPPVRRQVVIVPRRAVVVAPPINARVRRGFGRGHRGF